MKRQRILRQTKSKEGLSSCFGKLSSSMKNCASVVFKGTNITTGWQCFTRRCLCSCRRNKKILYLIRAVQRFARSSYCNKVLGSDFLVNESLSCSLHVLPQSKHTLVILTVHSRSAIGVDMRVRSSLFWLDLMDRQHVKGHPALALWLLR